MEQFLGAGGMGLVVAALLELLDGNRALFGEWVRDFLAASVQLVASMREALVHGDSDTLVGDELGMLAAESAES